MRYIGSVLGLMGLWLASVAQAETRLLMAEEPGCPWCARWDAEISEIYPKTTEGQMAPLVRFNMHQQVPDGITLNSQVRFSPTFILVKEGVEVDRIEGYPGEDFFWGLLGMMLERAGIEEENTG